MFVNVYDPCGSTGERSSLTKNLMFPFYIVIYTICKENKFRIHEFGLTRSRIHEFGLTFSLLILSFI